MNKQIDIDGQKQFGTVYLVGAGPGDPGLLTLRGKDCLEHADVVIYDELVHPVILEYAAKAERIYVGKKNRKHSVPQEDTNRILCEQAEKHTSVVRLKGGDPFVFGRGGEEALALAERGIPFEVVPGITAGIAAPAYAGIPVTHRNVAASVTFITGHLAGGQDNASENKVEKSCDWPKSGTLCFYMGLVALPEIVRLLKQQDRDGNTPVAVIEWGTFARQRTVTATIDTIEAVVKDANMYSPAMIVVGEVVSLRETINWFEQRPLFGLRIVVTHTRQRKGALENRLREMGAAVLELPSLEILPQDTQLLSDTAQQSTNVSSSTVNTSGHPGDQINSAWDNLDQFDWILLASVNAAHMLFRNLDQRNLDSRALAGIGIVVLGQATEEIVCAHGIRPDVCIEGYQTDKLVQIMGEKETMQAKHILLPRADIARSNLGKVLRDSGAVVTEVVAYKTRSPQDSTGYCQKLLQFSPHVLLFTNASAGRFFMDLLDPATRHFLMENSVVASIGPVTTMAIQEYGFSVGIEPARHDVEHLVEAICHWHRDRT